MDKHAPLSSMIQIDDVNDTLTICGIKYSAELFKDLAYRLNPNELFRIAEREDGVITIYRAGNL